MAKQGLIIISVADELATPHAIGYEQGRALQQTITTRLNELAEGGALWLSFKDIQTVTTAFLSEAIGKFHQAGHDVYGKNVFAADMAIDNLNLLEYVVDHADLYHRNPEAFRSLQDDLLEALTTS